MSVVTKTTTLQSLPSDVWGSIASFLPQDRNMIALTATISKAFAQNYQQGLSDYYITSMQSWNCWAFLDRIPGRKIVVNDIESDDPKLYIEMTLPPNHLLKETWNLIAKIYPFKKGETKAFSKDLICYCKESTIRRNLHNAACLARGDWLDTHY